MKNVEIATNFLKKLKNWCDKNMIGATECLSKFLFDVTRI